MVHGLGPGLQASRDPWALSGPGAGHVILGLPPHWPAVLSGRGKRDVRRESALPENRGVLEHLDPVLASTDDQTWIRGLENNYMDPGRSPFCEDRACWSTKWWIHMVGNFPGTGHPSWVVVLPVEVFYRDLESTWLIIGNIFEQASCVTALCCNTATLPSIL